MKVIIAPKYQSYKDFIHRIPFENYPHVKMFCNHRNKVELVCIEGQYFVIKKYKRPTIANCIIYTWFRKNKAKKAWENAYLLQQFGLETASPVAYIVHNKWGFFHTAWFISEYLPYLTIDETFENNCKKEEKERLINDFINYTLRLHALKIVHRDYNRGNILVHREADGYHFALVDINRLLIDCPLNVKKSMKSLLALKMDWNKWLELLPKYAEGRGFKIEDCIFYISIYEHYHAVRSKIKHGFKQLVGLELKRNI